MRLAGDDTVIMIGGEAIRLRPSLRAAVRLERQFDGFGPLLQALTDHSLKALLALVRECGDLEAEPKVLARSLETWADRFPRLLPALVHLVLDLADVDPDAARAAISTDASRVPHADAYRQIFGIATGILGWSPANAWSATIPEISAALDQHVAMLRAQNGAPPEVQAGPDLTRSSAAELAEFAALNSI